MRALLAAAVATALLAVPAPAAPDDSIVITGSTTGWVDITLPGPPGRSFHLREATVTMAGRYGGFYAVQRSRPPGTGAIDGAGGVMRLRRFDTDVAPAEVVTGYPVFSTGVVRLYLVADGPTTVRIRTDGFRASVRPRHRAAARVSVAPLRAAPDGGWRASHLVSGGDRTVGASAVLLAADAAPAADVALCTAPPGATCSDGRGSRLPAWYGAYGSAALWVREWRLGELGRGPQVAHQTVSHVRAPRAAVGAAFVLDLG